MRGLYLRSWRYGPETETLVAKAFEREHWNSERWRSWQEERLSYVLDRAATKVPYYREHWQARRRHGDRSSPEYLENWTTLDKESVRKNPRAFVADDCDVRRMFREHTSGSTGKPLDIWWSQKTVREWYALFEARWRRWYGLSRFDRWAILGGQLVTPTHQRQPPFWVWNAPLHQLYMSSYHLAPEFIPYYLDALKRYRIQYLWGYTSALYSLAQEALRLGRDDLKMTVAITNAEPLCDYQRREIEKAFHCACRETYGMAEIVAAASECQSQQLHLWPEVGLVEVLDDNYSNPAIPSGSFVCTGLMNEDMPLIRYVVGDRGILAEGNGSCSCGRTMPQISSVEGRNDDVLYTVDGRCIGRLDPVFKAQLPIREAQIIQESLSQVRVRYVPAPGYVPENGTLISESLRERMGNVNVILESVKQIPRGANGKFRAVICLIPSTEHQAG